jgi:hypothetical protein
VSRVENSAKEKLQKLMEKVQPVINQCLNDFERQEIEFILSNYRRYLKINLEQDFEKARQGAPVQLNHEDSAFNEILSAYMKDKP